MQPGTAGIHCIGQLYNTVGTKYFRKYQIYSNGVCSRKDICFGQRLRVLSTCNKPSLVIELPAVDKITLCRAFLGLAVNLAFRLERVGFAEVVRTRTVHIGPKSFLFGLPSLLFLFYSPIDQLNRKH
jgi:hypothetical protein